MSGVKTPAPDLDKVRANFRKRHGRIPARADYANPYLAEDEIDPYAEALFRIAEIVFQTRRLQRKPFLPPEPGKRFGLNQESIHDVALIVGECSALLKLHATDRITIENKVIERLVKPANKLA
jgi:hypothetical protein